jgi:hypothetical protein
MIGMRCRLGMIVLVLPLAAAVADEPGRPQEAPTQSRTFDISGNATLEFRVSFPAVGKAEVWVSSSRNTDVDLYVFDANNQLVAHDISTSKDCYVSFTPVRGQLYRLRVKNLGRGSNTCTLKHTSPETR